MELVKCADCGYLGVRHVQTQALVSPGPKQRESGQGPKESIGVVSRILEEMPACAVGAFNLYAEYKKASATSQPAQNYVAAKSVLQEGRHCEQFTPWIQWLTTPKEHIEMNLLKEQRTWQAGQRRSDRRFNAVVTIVATAVAGIIGLLGTVLGAYLSKPTAPVTPPAATASTAPGHLDTTKH